jgi:hypothetical protein
MKRKLLFILLCAYTFITVLGINISGALKSNRQDIKLETLNIVAIANAEVVCGVFGPYHNPIFGASWCENMTYICCDFD